MAGQLHSVQTITVIEMLYANLRIHYICNETAWTVRIGSAEAVKMLVYVTYDAAIGWRPIHHYVDHLQTTFNILLNTRVAVTLQAILTSCT